MFAAGAKQFDGKNDDTHYGTPEPSFAWPSARINGQAADWPTGKFLPPCLIPPPTVTLVGNILTVNGSQVNLSSLLTNNCDLIAPCFLGDAEATLFSPTSVINGVGETIVFRAENVGTSSQNNAHISFDFGIIGNPAPDDFDAMMVAIEYSGGSIGPLNEILWSDLQSDGYVIPTFPPGSSVIFTFTATFANTGARTFTGKVTLRPGQTDLTPENNTSSVTIVSSPSLAAADLLITSASSSPGAGYETAHTALEIIGTNNGPSNITGAIVQLVTQDGLGLTGPDDFTLFIDDVSVDTGILFADLAAGYTLPALNVGQVFKITGEAAFAGNPGIYQATVAVFPPFGTVDPNLANNSRTIESFILG